MYPNDSWLPPLFSTLIGWPRPPTVEVRSAASRPLLVQDLVVLTPNSMAASPPDWCDLQAIIVLGRSTTAAGALSALETLDTLNCPDISGSSGRSNQTSRSVIRDVVEARTESVRDHLGRIATTGNQVMAKVRVTESQVIPQVSIFEQGIEVAEVEAQKRGEEWNPHRTN